MRRVGHIFAMSSSQLAHLTQPLDVAVFGPMKRFWRQTLTEHKQYKTHKACSGIPKEHFPLLLKNLEERMEPTQAANIISGFRKCGIVPLDRSQVVRLLDRTNVDSMDERRNVRDTVADVVVARLSQTLSQETPTRAAPRKKNQCSAWALDQFGGFQMHPIVGGSSDSKSGTGTRQPRWY